MDSKPTASKDNHGDIDDDMNGTVEVTTSAAMMDLLMKDITICLTWAPGLMHMIASSHDQ